MPYTFIKEERLYNFHLIDKLFNEGESFVKYPLRVVYHQVERFENFPAQVIVSVSKRKFKRANKRNLIRRRIKEAYRLNKQTLYDNLNQKETSIVFAIIYLPSELLPYSEIEKGVNKVIKHLNNLPLNEQPKEK